MTSVTAKTIQQRNLKNTLLSVIVPCFNESEVIQLTHKRLQATLQFCAVDFEIIYVNDGSSDDTLAQLRQLAQASNQVKIISLSRNFGHQLAVTAGIDHAGGDAIVIIDADLQDPPEVIEQMLEKWVQGYDVVYGTRAERPQESRLFLWSAKLFYRLLRRLSSTPIPLDTGDFRLIDRRVAEAFKNMPERDRYVRGMITWVGFRQIPVHYDREPRAAGESKYPFKKLVGLALNGILSFSTKPLRLATWIGVATSTLALVGIIYVILVRLLTEDWVSGWALLMVAVLFIGGVQLLFLGIIGEYIARIYQEGKKRPLYIVSELLGLESSNSKLD